MRVLILDISFAQILLLLIQAPAKSHTAKPFFFLRSLPLRTMSYAAFKMIHEPTGVENCGIGFITHSHPLSSHSALSNPTPSINNNGNNGSSNLPSDDAGAPPPKNWSAPLPNIVITKANIVEVYSLRLHEDIKRPLPLSSSSSVKRGNVMSGLSGAFLELACHLRLHGNVESMSILAPGNEDGCRKRDAIILSFRDAKISVLEFDDSANALRISSLHYFEGPDWWHLKRGREKFARGPLVKSDPQGRCGGVLLYESQVIILQAAEAGSGVGDDETSVSRRTISAHIELSYAINLHELDMKHVKDFVFIYGYIEPVMVVLHEKEPTWAGSIAWKHHTCTISALSISMTSKQHPLIWSANNLPHDAYKLLAVPSLLGGVVVVSANSLQYHSQSSSCTLALNDFARTVDGRPEIPRANVDVELDSAHVTWISSDTALFSAKTGLLLLLSLVHDGRAVQRLELTASRSSTLASCICTVGDAFFFLGSRLGDSLLVQFSCGIGSNTFSKSSKDEGSDFDVDTPSKRLRRASSDISQDIMSGEEAVPHNSTSSACDSSQQKAFLYTIRDLLINVGPLRDFAYGLRTNADLKEAGAAKQRNFELVACSGHGKNGSLCVFQQYIRPEQSTEVELEGCKGVWTVYHKSSSSNASEIAEIMTEESEYHAYIIFSFESQTRVLECADAIGEISSATEFFIKGPTISAGNLFSRRRIIQIYMGGLRLLDGQYMTQELLLGESIAACTDGVVVTNATIIDPYALLMLSDGSLHLVVGDASTLTLSISSPAIFQGSADSITACTLYLDKGPEPWLQKTSTDAWISTGAAAQDDIYCVVCRESGRLDIFEIPSFICVFSVTNFPSGKGILVDTYLADVMSGVQQSVEAVKKEEEEGKGMIVIEVCMQKWNDQHGRPFLFAILNDGTVLCYHAYLYAGQDNALKTEIGSNGENVLTSAGTSRLRSLRFSRMPLDSLTREETETRASGNRLATFRNVGGCEGVFLSGRRPTWLMVFRQRLRAHPQLCDEAILAFAPFHNINCKLGFLYVTSQGFLKICQLPHLNYDNYWPVAKFPLRGTPHQITYSAQLNLYALSLSVTVLKPASQILSLIDQDSSAQIDMEAEDAQRSYAIEEFEVRILESSKAGVMWENRGSISLQPTENVIALRMVTLMNTSTEEFETLLAIGTSFVQGEDVAAKGRILLLSVRSDQDASKNWASEVYSKEYKGAISAIAALQGYLLMATGPKIVLHNWNGQELNGFAFYDVPHYVVSLNIVKNFILFGDIHKSIFFLLWKEDGAQISCLAKDFGSLNCYATEFLIDDATLSLVVSDDQQNIEIFSYAPKSSDSWKGQKLLPRAEFHVGAHVSKFLRVQMLPSSISDRNNPYALICGTLNGSIGSIAPLDEPTFKRLQAVEKKLVHGIPHSCGLNPRAYRQFRSNGTPHRPGPNNIVDYELLQHYEMLPLDQQLDIANQIGSTRSQILVNLNDFNACISFL